MSARNGASFVVGSGVLASVGCSGGLFCNELNGLYSDKGILLPCVVTLFDIHRQIKVSIRCQWPKTTQHNVEDATLQIVECMEDGFHQLGLVVKEARKFLSQ
jgi:hypothetical protein